MLVLEVQVDLRCSRVMTADMEGPVPCPTPEWLPGAVEDDWSTLASRPPSSARTSRSVLESAEV